jgi:hypothetical protein
MGVYPLGSQRSCTTAHVSPTLLLWRGLRTYRLRLVEPAVTPFENVELWVEDPWIQSPVERSVS